MKVFSPQRYAAKSIVVLTAHPYKSDQCIIGEFAATARQEPVRHNERKKGLRLFRLQSLDFMVPEVGIEPTLPQGKGDFESPASTSFTTPACEF